MLMCRFGSDGYIDIAVKDFNYWHKGSIDLSQIGFFVTTSEAEAQLEVDLAQVCISWHLICGLRAAHTLAGKLKWNTACQCGT